jgi:hypothetical protein
MSFIRREIVRVTSALESEPKGSLKWFHLYSTWLALEWALEPCAQYAPYSRIMAAAEEPIDPLLNFERPAALMLAHGADR